MSGLTNLELLFHKSAYVPPWFSGFFSKTASALHEFAGGRFASFIGQDELVVYRLACSSLAMIVWALLRKRLTNAATFALPVLLVFVRWGAIEQLFILIALAALNNAPGVSAKLDSDQLKARSNLFLFALALAFANSRTWTYSLLPAALLWTLLQKQRWANFLRIIKTSFLTTLIFIVVFLCNDSFESLVSHITQRWLYVNEPRYSPLPWSGPEQILKAIALSLVLYLCRCLARMQPAPQNNKRLFTAILALAAGLHLVLYQKNILVADIALLMALTLSSVSGNLVSTDERHGVRQKLSTLFDALIKFTGIAWILCCVSAVTLAFAPDTHVVPALSATASGMLLVAAQHPLLSSSTAVAAAFAIYLGIIKTLRHERSTRPNIVMLLGLLTLLGSTELRSFFLWEQLRSALEKVPTQSQLLYLPRLEPLLVLMPELPQKNRLVTLFEGGSFMENEPSSMLLVPSSASEVCRAANWNIDSEYGIFTLCDAGQGTLLHLLPLN